MSCNTRTAPPLLAGDSGWLFPWIVSGPWRQWQQNILEEVGESLPWIGRSGKGLSRTDLIMETISEQLQNN